MTGIKGKTGVYKRTKIPWIKGKHHTEQTKEKMRQARLKNPSFYWLGKKRPEVKNWLANKGKNHYRWNPYRINILQDRDCTEYKEWRMGVYSRDGFKCKIANSDCRGRIEAHHILNYKNHPELRYEINNGITLCQAHHPHKRKDEQQLAPIFKELLKVR